MPELAEVEAVRRNLAPRIVGRQIIHAEITGRRTIRRQTSESFRSQIEGAEIIELRRWGKYLICDLASERSCLMHLRMSGRLRWFERPPTPPALHTHVIWDFENGSQLHFIDPRTFGEQFVLDSDAICSTLNLGPDPLDNQFGTFRPLKLARALLSTPRPLKVVLLDQHFVAGIGNIYADEICFAAGVMPTRISNHLSLAEAKSVVGYIRPILSLASDRGGSTLSDGQYVDAFGQVGSYQKLHKVHARAGQKCRKCGHLIDKVTFRGRSTYFCVGCQN